MSAMWHIRIDPETAAAVDELQKRIADKERINVSRTQVVLRLIRRGLAEETRKR